MAHKNILNLGYADYPGKNSPGVIFSVDCVVAEPRKNSWESSDADTKLREIIRQVEHLCGNCYPLAWPAAFAPPDLYADEDSTAIARVRKWLGLNDDDSYDFDDYRHILEQRGVLVIHGEDAPERWEEGHPLTTSFAEFGMDAWKLDHPSLLALATGIDMPLIYVKKSSPQLEVYALFHALWHVIPHVNNYHSKHEIPFVALSSKERKIRAFAQGCLLSNSALNKIDIPKDAGDFRRALRPTAERIGISIEHLTQILRDRHRI